MERLTVLGSGSWGTALAIRAATNGADVALWGFDPKEIDAIQSSKRNDKYLPGIDLPDNIIPTNNLAEALNGAMLVFMAVPSYAYEETLMKIKPFISASMGLVHVSKGLAQGRLLYDVSRTILGEAVESAVLSGPSFAAEVAKQMPTAVALASHSESLQKRVLDTLHANTFRIYTTDDVIGVAFGGVVKNVLAIAVGFADGLGYGANARSALITRGLAEMVRLGLALGARSETLMGLAGVGDLVLTCTDNQSRNRRFGLALGQGKSKEQAQALIGQVVEGQRNAKEIYELAKQYKIEMPIIELAYKVLYEDYPPMQAVNDLLNREPTSES